MLSGTLRADHDGSTMPTTAPHTAAIEPAERIVLRGLSWDQYVTISDALPESSGLRTAFDGNSLELMVTSFGHERYKKLIGRLIEMLTFELEIDICSGGQTTFRREDVERGLEPDQCYWIAHFDAMSGKQQWSPDTDPPPDLAVEIDVTSSSVDREGIYAGLGVAELWRFDGDRLRAYRLRRKRYQPSAMSMAFPFLKVSDLLPFIIDHQISETALIHSFVHWIRDQRFSDTL
jgi:Uma2 family endonuclease